MFDQFFDSVNPELYQQIKNIRCAEIIIAIGQQHYKNEMALLNLSFEIRKDSTEQGINLRSNKKEKIKFLKKELKKASVFIDNEVIRVSLKWILESTIEQIREKSNANWKIQQNLISSIMNNKEEYELLLSELDEILTPNLRRQANIDTPFSEAFRYISAPMVNSISISEACFPLDDNSIAFAHFSNKLMLLMLNEYAFYVLLEDMRKEIELKDDSQFFNGQSLDKIKMIIDKELRFFIDPANEKAKPISISDYKNIVSCILYVLRYGNLPKIKNRISKTDFTQSQIRKSFYQIHTLILGTNQINDLFIDLIHALFVQFDNTEKTNTKKKFSQ